MMNANDKIYDFLAVGVGPFNLSLACLTHPLEDVNGLFLDQNEEFDWHPGMLLEDTTLQVPFMADLVTLSDPTNPFSFLNYIKQQGLIYSFYIKESFFLLRKEYNNYCKWAIDQLPNVFFGIRVEDIHYSDEESCYIVSAVPTKNNEIKIYKTYKLVLGTGTSPAVPLCCKDLKDKAVHSSRYLYKKEELSTKDSITIMGGGQSAAEIFYDLLQSLETGYQLNWITRSPRFFPLEYSKLTLEMTSPEYVDYFYGLPLNKRDRLLSDQKNLYKGINQDLINDIFDLLYIKRLNGHTNVQLRTNSELKQASFDQDTETFNLHIHQVEEGKHYRHATKALVLATGYGYNEPTFISGIDDRIARDDEGRFQVNRNYSIDKGENEIFVQNAELHTHGFVTPDLGMGCYRNAHIIKSITGVAHYPIETRIAFQQFEVTNDEEIFVEEPLAMDV